MDTSASIGRYCEAWTRPDPARRAALLESAWAEGAAYTDPSVRAVGSGGLLAHIAETQARRRGAEVLRTSAVDAHHGVARFAWRVVQADGTALPEGLDVALLSADGAKMERVIGFSGPLGAPAGSRA